MQEGENESPASGESSDIALPLHSKHAVLPTTPHLLPYSKHYLISFSSYYERQSLSYGQVGTRSEKRKQNRHPSCNFLSILLLRDANATRDRKQAQLFIFPRRKEPENQRDERTGSVNGVCFFWLFIVTRPKFAMRQGNLCGG